MALKLSIGDFARMSHLSVKALRYYHTAGLLAPADVDPETGYRSYDLSQVATAHVIRRFRALEMPVEQIKAILSAPSISERNTLVVAHLKQMESDLEQTQRIVASLRSLLEASPAEIAVEYRSVPALRVAAITSVVEVSKLYSWFFESLADIQRVVRAQRVTPAGPLGGLFPTELFTDEAAELTVFVPISGAMSPSGNVVIRELPPVELAIAVHRGSLRETDRTFGSLGAHVLERTIAVDGPIREHYIVTREDVKDDSQLVTEIGWPIFLTS
jgi:DNA-binding transcriptional MerR regulator/effector-binding domain-containing protein